ncbi:hypothetical protein D0Y65_006892 [Glycine soja]|uniref:Uncharacterized protein n=1 Tax=Glycine soja TaxID=3848 RepID=A0A445LAU5_GLYSO|nr:hypothetical protein D0Y65_006892 [Glycine soja]
MPPSSTIPSSMQYFIMIPISSGEWNAKIYNSQLVDIEDMKGMISIIRQTEILHCCKLYTNIEHNIVPTPNLELVLSLLQGELVKSTYVSCNALFNKGGRKVVTMLASGQVYMEVLNKVIKDTLRMANTHNILEFNRCDARFLVQETINPREVRPARDFRVRLDERWCDCCKL